MAPPAPHPAPAPGAVGGLRLCEVDPFGALRTARA